MRILVALCFMALGANASTVGFVVPEGNVGRSGLVRIDGTVDQFGHDLAHDILFFGPSGIITKSGRNIQLTSDLHIANPRSKRAIHVNRDAIFGESGIVDPDGNNVQFTPEQVGRYKLVGPSGAVSSTGENIQFIRRRRHTRRDDILLYLDRVFYDSSSTFRPTILIEGPSAYILTDGTQIQKLN